MFAEPLPILQYTPPTCTLEVWVKSSFLFAKNKQKNLEKLSFELRFDDPRLPEDKQVTIKGDRNQLEALCDVVHSYVQYVLKQPPAALPLVPLILEKSQYKIKSDSMPSLKPQSLFAHELSLGSLQDETSGTTVQLSATQLFDLANALENYQDEIESLAVLKPKTNAQNFIFWGSIAATVLLAVGLNTGIIKVFPQSQQLAEKETNSAENSYPVPGAELQTPSPPPPVNIPSPTVPLVLKNIKRLPPPPPVQPPTVTNPNNVPNAGIIAIKPSVNQPISPTNTNANSNENSKEKNTTNYRLNTSNLTPNIPPPPPLKPASSPSVKVEQFGTLPPPRSDSSETRQKTTSLPNFSDEVNNDFPTNNIPKNQIAKTRDIPQLLEVKNYFKQRWQPKENLQQTLEYRLSIDSNGSLNRIIPIGQASKTNLDTTGMPLLGEAFVSPLTNQDRATIRLVLNPDGTVQTFIE